MRLRQSDPTRYQLEKQHIADAVIACLERKCLKPRGVPDGGPVAHAGRRASECSRRGQRSSGVQSGPAYRSPGEDESPERTKFSKPSPDESAVRMPEWRRPKTSVRWVRRPVCPLARNDSLKVETRHRSA
jgi:hypothetical protein